MCLLRRAEMYRLTVSTLLDLTSSAIQLARTLEVTGRAWRPLAAVYLMNFAHAALYVALVDLASPF